MYIPHQIMQWKSPLLEGATGVLGEVRKPEAEKIDVTRLYAKCCSLGEQVRRRIHSDRAQRMGLRQLLPKLTRAC